jgi:cell division transport system permease protein
MRAMSRSSDASLPPDGEEPTTQREAVPGLKGASRSGADMAAQTRKRSPGSGPAPIVPAGSVTGRSLTMVITIMCFLACLTAGGVYMINQSAIAWLHDIAAEVTVQIEAQDDPAVTDSLVNAVADYIGRQPGIVAARPMPLAESNALLEPWLGQTDILNSLPVPRLIAIELNRGTPPDIDLLRADLAKLYPAAGLDDHRRWKAQIQAVTRSLALGGLAILVLVGSATTMIIVSATRSAMASNREIVEVLNFVGANDRFISREFEKHFLALGVRAGVVGAALAMLVFLALPALVPLLGGGSVTAAELRNFVGGGVLDVPGYLLLAIVVVVVSALCMLTSRYSVFRILHARA